MSNKEHFTTRSRNRETKTVEGRFYPQGTGAVVNGSNVGRGFTVTRTGVGVFDIDFEEAYVDFLDFEGTPNMATGVNHVRVTAQKRNSQNALTGLTITNFSNAAAAVDIAAAATSFISFSAVMSDTLLPKV